MTSSDSDHPQPLLTSQGLVRDEWIDYNGHMNVAYYVLAFDHATDAFLDALGLDAGYRDQHAHSTFALEMHVTYDREIHRGDRYRITTRMLDADHKRIHMFHEMHHAGEGWLAASNEVITMHIDMESRRSAPFPAAVQHAVDALRAAHETLARPAAAGRVIGIRR